MITPANNEYPAIEWELRDQLENDPEERLIVYNAIGEDKEGKRYTGSIHYVCGEFDKVTDIEQL